MTARIVQGSVFDVLPTLTPGSVDCVITSPPYWCLRSYLPSNHAAKHLELGSEPTIDKFIENMVRVFRLVRDAMADHATCWLNMGDTYAVGTSGESRLAESVASTKGGGHKNGKLPRAAAKGIPAGNLCLIPQRLAIALQDDGWTVRSVIAYCKPAPMPQSLSGWQWRRCRVKVSGRRRDDRPTPANWKTGAGSHQPEAGRYEHEEENSARAEWQDCPGCPKCSATDGYVLRRGSWRPTSSWEPILMMSKSARYFGDGEPVKTPVTADSEKRASYGWLPNKADDGNNYGDGFNRNGGEPVQLNPAGANLRDTWRPALEDMTKEDLIDLIRSWEAGDMPDAWRISAECLKEKHYAAFPTKLVENCLLAGTSARGYCVQCGGPMVRVIDGNSYEPEIVEAGVRKVDDSRKDKTRKLNGKSKEWREACESISTIGWRPTCTCNAGTRPGLVCDPFSGSGRTGIACRRLGLDYIGIELSPEYVEMSRRLLKEDAPLFA